MIPGAYAGERLNLGNMREGPAGKCLCCQPDSGKPTVRDERGACGNVSYGGIRNPRCESKEHRSETLRLRLRASYFYPTVNGKRECWLRDGAGSERIKLGRGSVQAV